MTIFDLSRWPHWLARHYSAPVSQINALIRAGKLPRTSHATHAAALANPFDDSEHSRLESFRSVLDTAAEPFANDLHILAGKIRVHGELPYSKSLVEFRQFSYNPDPEAPLYPITRFLQPWKGHRVPVYQADLNAAKYREFAALWMSSGSNPYCYVPVGGEVPLGPFEWVYHQQNREELRLFRASFIEKLAEVIEARSLVIQ